MDQRGFTIVELILVTLLLGILVAIVPPLVPASREGLDSAVRKVKADVVTVQQMAMMNGINHGASFTSGGGYTLYQGTVATPVPDPMSGELFTAAHGQQQLARFGNIFITSNYQAEFDSMGRPVLGGGGTVIFSNGSQTKSIRVTANTGLVEIP